MIQELNGEQKYQLLYALSGMHYLFELILQMRKIKSFPSKRVHKYKKVCEGLINFLYGQQRRLSYFSFEN